MGVTLKDEKSYALIIKYSTFSLVLNYWWPYHGPFHLPLIRPSLHWSVVGLDSISIDIQTHFFLFQNWNWNSVELWITLPLIRPSLVGCWFEADIDVLELAELNIIFSFTEYIPIYKIFAGLLESNPALQKIGDIHILAYKEVLIKLVRIIFIWFFLS